MARTKGAHRAVAPQLGLESRRIKNGVSLEQIAESTKISIRFLKAIEDEEFDELPGGIFDTSYLRQYATATGFDEAKLIAQYERKVAKPEPVPVDQAGRGGGLFRWFRVSAASR